MARNKKTDDSANLSLAPVMVTAIDPTGSIGILYDACRNILCSESRLSVSDEQIKEMNVMKCSWLTGNKIQRQNLLDTIDMPLDLQLNAWVVEKKTDGVASVTTYPYPIDKYTRFFLCSYTCREEEVFLHKIQLPKKANCSADAFKATHVITGVVYGFDIIAVLQLPSEIGNVKRIDDVLEKLCSAVMSGSVGVSIDQNDAQILNEILDTKIYSNIPTIAELPTLNNINCYINEHKQDQLKCPKAYRIHPIKSLLANNQSDIRYKPIAADICETILRYIITQSDRIANIKYTLECLRNGVLGEHLEDKLNDQEKALSKLESLRQKFYEVVRKTITNIHKERGAQFKESDVCRSAQNKHSETIYKNVEENISKFKEKEMLITELKEQNIDYYNVVIFNLNKTDYKATLPLKLRLKDQKYKIICINDKVKKHHHLLYNEMREKLMNERANKKNLRLIYADFSYTFIDMRDLEIIDSEDNKMAKKPKPSKMISKMIKSPPPPPKQISSEKNTTSSANINILLLGETGVGKSTFINAFVNYLKFETFEEARTSKPVVLMPVLFMLTVGDNFEERTVKFGDFDNDINEDFSCPGESVTQNCRTYEFLLNSGNGKKLCIIDTPGFGDTRGVEQDDINMQIILEYINELSHLNAVCILLKPNVSRLCPFFRACFIQLLDLLGPHAHQNLIFCFTNARTTFYRPGDTARQLRELLSAPSLQNIPFGKENTFCFDNESFRYLVALQNQIKFEDDEIHDYKNSWSFSVHESNRLIDYILETLGPCRSADQSKSKKRAQVEITHMIRPMLESVHNILRNIILYRGNIKNKCIELIPKPIYYRGKICYSCSPTYKLRGNLWVCMEIPHKFQKKCLDCECSGDHHTSVNYSVRFEYSNNTSSIGEQAQMQELVNSICNAAVEFDFFLVHMAGVSKSYVFLSGLQRKIEDEIQICKTQTPSQLNSLLCEELKMLMESYQNKLQHLKSNSHSIDLALIHKQIERIHQCPHVREQLEVIKNTQEMMTEIYEI